MKTPELISLLIVFGFASICSAQFESTSNIATQKPTRSPGTPVYRTIVTYDGSVRFSTPTYELMPNGRVIVKRQGMRFDGAGYFWSPTIHDNVVRRNHYENRILGTTSQYWPPLQQSNTVAHQPTNTLKSYTNPYFGTGTLRVTRRQTQPSSARMTNNQQRTQWVKCPNGSYAIICQ